MSAMQVEKEGKPDGKLKEDLSRQEGAYGSKMIGKLKKMKCAVFGLRGAGIEVAKNLMLAGPHTVMVHDDEKVTIADCGTNFYVSPEDVKESKTRAKACEAALSEINPNTYFRIHSGDITAECVEEFDVVVFADQVTPLAKLYEINEYCRGKGKDFIYVTIHGMLLSIFSDFGPKHEIFDTNGEAERSVVIDKVEIVPEPYTNVGEFLKLCGGKGDEEVKKLSYKDKKLTAIEVLTAKMGITMDEKRQKSITVTEILELAGSNAKTCKEKKCGKITVVGQRHLLHSGDHVKFEEIEMSKKASEGKSKVFKIGETVSDINSTCEIKTHRTNSSVFYIGDISGLGEYKGGGIGTQVKMPVYKSYKSMRETFSAPQMEPAFADMSHFGDGPKAHIAWAAVQTFFQENKRLPGHCDKKDAETCVEIAKKFGWADALGGVDESFVTKVAMFAGTETNAFAALAGGIVAQEAMKQTGKYSPMDQWMHFHALQLLDEEKAGKPKGDRYDHYRCMFGDTFVKAARKAKFFLVGCGALGCEFLKNIAMTGLGCSEEGEVHITDDDVIELSNLSRQFLFRRRHVGKLKSESASGSAMEMNPDLKKGLKLHTSRVEPKTESEFSDRFWGGLDFVVNALDNLKARNYVDTKCAIFQKPLFESGTLGTQANQTVHIPHKTPSYQEGSPPGEGQGIAMCTMTHFPYEPLHCIEWSRVMFGQLFEDGPSAYEDLRKSGAEKYLEKTGRNKSEEHGILKKTLKWIKIASDPTLTQCVKLAMEYFIHFFRDDVKDLIHAFPEDARNVDSKTKEDKGPFWHGRRRFPRAHECDTKNPDHMEFIYRTSCIFADVFGLTKKENYPDKVKVTEIAAGLPIPKWEPKKDLDVQVDENAQAEKKAISTEEYDEIQSMRAEIKAIDVSKMVPIFPADFEKDDDTNHHVDWITSSTNLRAWTRKLKQSTRQHCRMIAGRIIAAIATATAAITGLVFLEVYKLLMKTDDINEYRWSTINLATNVFAIELPPDPAYKRTRTEKSTVEEDDEIKKVETKITCIPEKFTSYDFVEFKTDGNVLLPALVEAFEKQQGVKLTLLAEKGNNKGKAIYQTINEGVWQMQKKMAERMVKIMRNPMQKQEAQARLDSANAFLEQAKKQKEAKFLDAYVEAYGPFTDPKRNFVVLEAKVEPADRELDGNERIEIPAIKCYFN